MLTAICRCGQRSILSFTLNYPIVSIAFGALRRIVIVHFIVTEAPKLMSSYLRPRCETSMRSRSNCERHRSNRLDAV